MKPDQPKPKVLHLVPVTHNAAPPIPTRDFRRNPRLCGDFEDLLELGQHKARLEQQEARLRRRIQTAMGKAQRAVFTQGYAQWVKEKDRIALNSQAVLEEFPALLEEFPQIQIKPPTFEIHGNPSQIGYDGGEHDD